MRHVDTTDCEQWDEYCNARYPWMPSCLRILLLVVGCEAPDPPPDCQGKVCGGRGSVMHDRNLKCVCQHNFYHKKSCRFRIAATCRVAVGCEYHARDVCPECDPCTC